MATGQYLAPNSDGFDCKNESKGDDESMVAPCSRDDDEEEDDEDDDVEGLARFSAVIATSKL